MRSVRVASGRTQDELAEMIGSARPTISRMERGLPATTTTIMNALSACGYELVVVPRGTNIVVR